MIFPDPVPFDNVTLAQTLSIFVGDDRAANILKVNKYNLIPSAAASDPDLLRETFESAATDGTWKCANRDSARKWAAAGGKVWVGEFRQGVTYPDNENAYCQKTGVVCHEVSLAMSGGNPQSSQYRMTSSRSAAGRVETVY